MEFLFSSGTRCLYLAEGLRARGYTIYQIINVLVYERPRGPFFKLVEVGERKFVAEVPNPRTFLPWRGLFTRALIQLLNTLFFFIAILRNLRDLREVDVILCGIMHPFVDVPAFFLRKLTGALLVLDVCDPLVEALDLVRSNRLLISFFKRIGAVLLRWAYSSADGIIAHTRSMGDVARRYTDKPVFVIYNPVDTSTFRPMGRGEVVKELEGHLPLRELEGRFVVLYSGMMGPCQDVGRVVEAAKELGDDVVFLLIGFGEEKEELVRRAEELGLKNVMFPPRQPWTRMPYIINLADACILPLRGDPLFHLALPRKFFEYIACGKPVICFCPRGEATRLVEEWGAGLVVEPDDVRGFAEAVRWLSENPDAVEEMGRRARLMAEELFSMEKMSERLHEVLIELRSSRGATSPS